MLKTIKIFYSCSELPAKLFSTVIPTTTTCEELLKIISEKHKSNYISLFIDGSQIDNFDLIEDYYEEDTQIIFYASINENPPTPEFIQNVISSKSHSISSLKSQNSESEEIADHNKIYSKMEPPKLFYTTKINDSNNQFISNLNDFFTKENEIRPEDITEEYVFYFTGSTKDHLMKGIKVELNTSMNPVQCRDKLLEYLEGNKVSMVNKQLIIYLSGGIPFIGGTLGDIYLKKDMKAKKNIYGVLTRQIPDSLLNRSCLYIFNVSNKDNELLISPLCDSTERGLSDIACLLGYLKYSIEKSDMFIKASAAVIHFAPFVTSMMRIIENNNVIGRDVVTVCSTLFTFFKFYVAQTCSENQVFEYALRMSNLITNVKIISNKLPLVKVNVKSNSVETKFLNDLKLGPYVYFWRGDVGENFNYIDFELKRIDDIEKAYDITDTFTPILPLSIRVAPDCSIVKGKTHEYLYLMQSSLKGSKYKNNIDIIDPFTGIKESKDLEMFVMEQINEDEKDFKDIIDPDNVKQIIMINLDESKINYSDSCNDLYAATVIQYLTAFINRLYGERIPCIQGLVSFSDTIEVRCKLSPFVLDLENKGLKELHPGSTPKLWDSLVRSCEEIVKFGNENNEVYKNAVSRILVISSGEDYGSNAKVVDVVKMLIMNKIIVDSVIINTEDECKMLCAVSHATGGVSFKSKDIMQGLSLFEQNSFFNLDERKNKTIPLIPRDRTTIPSRLKIDQITEDLMDRAKENAEFDLEVPNKEIIQASVEVRLATASHVFCRNRDAVIPNKRQRRILEEFHEVAQVCELENNAYFDPDIKIFTFQSNLDRWKVFIKGPEGTPYANKWWYLFVTFPELYPIRAPIFRFSSVPYHINVSSEGKMCINIIEKGYFSSMHVIDIIQEIKELFLHPDVELPIRIEAYDLFLNNPDRYLKLANESAQNNAKNDYKDYIGSSIISNEIPSDFILEPTEKVPLHLMSQISGKTIKKEKMIKASSGVYYDKNELMRLIASDKNPVCVITGKILTEKLDDLINAEENDAI